MIYHPPGGPKEIKGYSDSTVEWLDRAMVSPDELDIAEKRTALIASLRRRSYITSDDVADAMGSVPREVFVPDELRSQAYDDNPLPIGSGQTISAPHMVAIMVELLELKEGLKVLEIGGGSGYHAAVVASLVGKSGHVYSMEWHGPLVERARKSLMATGLLDRVTLIKGDGSLGHPNEAPYDRIFISCGAPDIPKPLVEQLAEGGIILVPVGRGFQDLVRGVKTKGRIRTEDHGGCVFVPLVGEHGFKDGTLW